MFTVQKSPSLVVCLQLYVESLYFKRGKVSVTYICNGGRGQLSSECRHNENGAASAVGDVIMRMIMRMTSQ